MLYVAEISSNANGDFYALGALHYNIFQQN